MSLTDTRFQGVLKRWASVRHWAFAPVNSGGERLAYILFFALQVAGRMPRILGEGRFWAEEGQTFFVNAWNLPWSEALIVSYGGYLNFCANLAGVLARHFAPLSTAPYVSTAFALLIQCIPAVVIVTSRAPWLRSRIVCIAALLIIATPPCSAEVWLTSIHSQFHLALAAGLILSLPTRGGVVGAMYCLTLSTAALTGPASWALAPLFAIRAAIDRSPARATQALFISAALLFQLVFFFRPMPGREIGIAPSLFGAIVLVKHIVLPFVSLHWIGDGNPFASFSESLPLWPLLAVVLIFAVAIYAALLHFREAPIFLLLSGAAIAASGYIGAIGPKAELLQAVNGGRYAFVPQVLLGLALLSWGIIHQRPTRLLAQIAVVWLIVVGLSDYVPPRKWIIQTGPQWAVEVQKWHRDPNYRLQIWPAGWSMTLTPPNPDIKSVR